MGQKINVIKAKRLLMYKIFAQIGFSTSRQTFNKRFASPEKSPIFKSQKSYPQTLPTKLNEKITTTKYT